MLQIPAFFALFVALSCNLDNVGVGVSYGARSISIPFASNFLIALITASGTLLCMLFGQQVLLITSPKTAVVLGASLFIGMGLWVTVQETLWRSRAAVKPGQEPAPAASEGWFSHLLLILEQPFLADRDFSGHIDLKESLLLSLALMLNNIPNGIGAGMLGLPLVLTTLAVGLLSILTFWVGMAVGRSLRPGKWGRWTGAASGVLLILMGISQIALAIPLKS